mmetsp:Transcript_16401/g.44479  ORF Transcript_16401/g.44479 Transcript_16401/m.44479 type:complete len:154 (-) Transcript_16401:1601-2062(-)
MSVSFASTCFLARAISGGSFTAPPVTTTAASAPALAELPPRFDDPLSLPVDLFLRAGRERELDEPELLEEDDKERLLAEVFLFFRLERRLEWPLLLELTLLLLRFGRTELLDEEDPDLADADSSSESLNFFGFLIPRHLLSLLPKWNEGNFMV